MVKAFLFVFLVALVFFELCYGSRWTPLKQLLFLHKTWLRPYGREGPIVFVHTALTRLLIQTFED